MSRALLVARREFLAQLRSKVFLVSLVLSPALGFGAGMMQMRRATAPGVPTVLVYGAAPAMVEAWREVVGEDAEESGDEPSFAITSSVPGPFDQAARAALVPRMAEIGAVADLSAGAVVYATDALSPHRSIRLRRSLQEAIRRHRLHLGGVEPQTIRDAFAPVDVEERHLRLGVEGLGEEDDDTFVARSVTAMVIALIMFFSVIVVAQPAMQATMEEKQQRIVEVLLGCVSPLELLLGKLLACVAVGCLILMLYGIMGIVVALALVDAQVISLSLVAWAIVFEVLHLVVFSAIFLGVGSACSDLKDFQGLALPVMLMLALPLVFAGSVIEDPSGTVARVGTFIPPVAPLFVMLRLGAGSVSHVEVLLSALTTAAGGYFIVLAASRLFRVAILSQGKTPSLKVLARWALSG